MKKIYFILSLVFIALFTACNNDFEDVNPESKDNKQKVSAGGYRPTYEYAFAFKTPNNRTKAFMLNNGYWNQEYVINIKFMNGSEAMQQKVIEISQEWQQYINLTFNFVPSSTADRDAAVRISFTEPGSDYTEKMTWSYLGKSAIDVRRGNTANIGMLTYNDPTELNSIDFRAQVLRVFGYILGLVPEHLAPMSNVKISYENEDEALNYYSRYGWDEDLIYKYIIDYYNEASFNSEHEGIYDPLSIMQIYVPNYLLTPIDSDKSVPNLEVLNTELSVNDITFIKAMYPRTEASPYEKGGTGEVYLYLPTGTFYDGTAEKGHIGIALYDWDSRTATTGGQTRTYKTIGVGEYDWFSENLRVQYRALWGIDFTIFNMTQAEVGRITKQSPAPDATQFVNLFGTWITDYGSETGAIRNDFTIYDQKGGTQLTGWDLPDVTAILQMIGQMPVKYADIKNNIYDFMYGNETIDNINSFGISNLQKWSSTSGLVITPLGGSTNEPQEVRSSYYAYGTGFGLKMKGRPRGFFINNDIKATVNASLYHFCSARYCRPYTNEELGYKMYYSIKEDKVIYKSLNDNPTGDYLELPRGLERGIAPRYTYRDPNNNLTKYKVVEKWSDIKDEAQKIRSVIDIVN